jgi:inosine-uridine nucleoside N-ribohydrolase
MSLRKGTRWGIALCLALLAATTRNAIAAPDKPASAQGEACVLIDTDFDIDDMMAIPVIIQNRHVAAVVTTEGATTAALGASALVRLLAAPGASPPVPVIVGATPAANRGYKPPTWLAAIRATMERANWFVPAAIPPKRADRSFEEDVAHAVENCAHITLLVIGPWTSFVQYGPLIIDRIDSIVAQGRPTHSEAEGTNTKTFNCAYDVTSCEKAFTQTQALHPVWVDVPKRAASPYSPTIGMVQALRPDGLPGALKTALLAKQDTWRTDLLDHANGNSYLWDQLAALFVLRPNLFHLVDAHMEPKVPAADIRRIWTEAVNVP